MKFIQVMFISLFIYNISFSQSLKLEWMDSEVKKNFITTVQDSLDYSYKASAHGEMKNVGFGDIEILSSVVFLEKAENHSISYCTRVCYAAFDEDFYEVESSLLKSGGSTDDIFSGSDGSAGFQIYLFPFAPDGSEYDRFPGVTIIRVKFMNIADPENDFVEFDIKFNISVDGVNSVEYGKPGDFTLSPNPANDYIKLDINSNIANNFKNSNLKIYDLLGNVVLNIDNYSPNQEINVNSLSTGRYIQAITGLDGKTYTLPLIKN